MLLKLNSFLYFIFFMTCLYFKNNILLRSARPGDGLRLAPELRAADGAELQASFPGESPGVLLERFRAASRECYWLELAGRPAALFGVSAPCWLARRGCVWLLTGNAVERMPVSFVRVARMMLARFLGHYPELYNFTDERYVSALRFIKRLGGRFDGSFRTCGDIRFLYFTFRRNLWEE